MDRDEPLLVAAPQDNDKRALLENDKPTPLDHGEAAPMSHKKPAPLAIDETAPLAIDETAPLAIDKTAPLAHDEPWPVVTEAQGGQHIPEQDQCVEALKPLKKCRHKQKCPICENVGLLNLSLGQNIICGI